MTLKTKRITWRDAALERLVSQCAPQEEATEDEERELFFGARNVLMNLNRVEVERDWDNIVATMRRHPLAIRINDRAEAGYREAENEIKRLTNEEVDHTRPKRLVERPVSVAKPPGQLFARLASLLSAKNPVRRIIEQTTADMRTEHFDALESSNIKGARWIAIRGNLATFWAVLTYLGFWAIVGRVIKMWKSGE